MKRFSYLTLILALFYSFTSYSQDNGPGVLELRDFPDLEGREGMMLRVVYPPGRSSPKHRHNAHTFVYVLEGTVEMQVEGGELQRLSAGESFYENPDDIHIVSRNVSDTEPAVLIVFFVKKEGEPVSEPVE